MYLEEYAETLEKLIKQTLPVLRGLILVTPYFIEPNLSDPMRVRMDEYGVVVKKLAKKYDAVLVDTQAVFDLMLEHMHPMEIAWDRIHPNRSGYALIAQCFLNAIGFQLQ